MSKNVLLAIGGLGIYACSAYTGYHYYKLSQMPTPEPGCHHPKKQKNFLNVYDTVLESYTDLE